MPGWPRHNRPQPGYGWKRPTVHPGPPLAPGIDIGIQPRANYCQIMTKQAGRLAVNRDQQPELLLPVIPHLRSDRAQPGRIKKARAARIDHPPPPGQSILQQLQQVLHLARSRGGAGHPPDSLAAPAAGRAERLQESAPGQERVQSPRPAARNRPVAGIQCIRAAWQIATKASACSAAPPIRPPSMSGRANSARALSGLTLPPYLRLIHISEPTRPY